MKEPNQYTIPPAALNTTLYGDEPMPGRDAAYPNHVDWLRANAASFYFTDKQLIDAAQTVFPADNFKEYCGIYFLIRDRKIVYVGQSLTIGRRISEHLRMPDSFSWIETPKWCREYIEAYYINRIMPAKNQGIPGIGLYTRLLDEVSHSEEA